MKALLSDFRTEFRDQLLDLLWRQWTALGVSGHGGTWEGSAIDPEALLLFSCSIARHDARLFDAMLDWMRINGRYINVQRVKRIFVQEGFAGETVFQAVAAVTKTPAYATKWGRSTQSVASGASTLEPLFYLKDGKPMPVLREKDPLFAAAGLRPLGSRIYS